MIESSLAAGGSRFDADNGEIDNAATLALRSVKRRRRRYTRETIRRNFGKQIDIRRHARTCVTRGPGLFARFRGELRRIFGQVPNLNVRNQLRATHAVISAIMRVTVALTHSHINHVRLTSRVMRINCINQ